MPRLTIAHFRHAEYYLEVLKRANALYKQGPGGIQLALEVFDLEWTNIAAGQTWAAGYPNRWGSAATLCVEYAENAGDLLRLRRLPAEHLRWLDAAVTTLEARDIEDLAIIRQLDKLHARALEVAREMRDKGDCVPESSPALSFLGISGPQEQLRRWDTCLRVAVITRDRDGMWTAYHNAGLVWADVGRPHQAIECFGEALEIACEMGLGQRRWPVRLLRLIRIWPRGVTEERREMLTAGPMGDAWASVGRHERAIEYYERQLAISRKLNDRETELTVTRRLGRACAYIGDKRRAIEFLRAALRIAGDLGDRNVQVTAFLEIAASFRDLGDYAQSRTSAEAAVRICDELHDHERALVARRLLADPPQSG